METKEKPFAKFASLGNMRNYYYLVTRVLVISCISFFIYKTVFVRYSFVEDESYYFIVDSVYKGIRPKYYEMTGIDMLKNPPDTFNGYQKLFQGSSITVPSLYTGLEEIPLYLQKGDVLLKKKGDSCIIVQNEALGRFRVFSTPKTFAERPPVFPFDRFMHALKNGSLFGIEQ